MNARFNFLDSLVNLVSGIGTSRDKSVHTQYVATYMDRAQLDAAYRGDWIARKVIDLPALDATRAWRGWQAEDDQIEDLEETEHKFDIQAKVRRAMIRARLYGGAALVIGVEGAGSSEQELDLEKVQQDSLKFVHVVSQHELTCEEMETDIMSPYYGQPKFYRRNAIFAGEAGSGVDVKIHPSRIVRLIGCEIPDITQVGLNIWGDSVLQIVNDAVIAAGTVSAGVAALVPEAKSDVIKIVDLSKNLSSADYTTKLTTRLAYANQIKSMINTRVMDATEEWEQMQVNFGTLPDIMRMYLLIASGAADIPATRMLGQSAQGLNSTGESDIRNYYDRVSSDQSTTLQPALQRLDEVIIRTTFGDFDEDIYYEWNSLWQMSDLEKADIAIKKAQVHKTDVDIGLISPEALREARENQLIEDGTYPGFEAALKEFPDEVLPTAEEKMQQEIEFAQATAAAKQPPGEKVVPKKKAADSEVTDYNKNHRPGGSEAGGEFTSGGGGSSPTSKEWAKTSFAGSSINPHELTKLSGSITKMEKSSLEQYTESGYSDWNNCLRRNGVSSCVKKFPDTEDPGWEEGGLPSMLKLIDKSSLKKDAVLYRGVSKMKMTPEDMRKAIGKKITIPGITSTSLNRGVAEGFRESDWDWNGGGTIFEIYAKKGLPGLGFKNSSGGERESEVILPHDSQFKVESVITDFKKRHTAVRLVYLGKKKYKL